uniref:Tripartite motif-containing protein 16-like n=1 Tax=Mastacembelus armatus TaxID=205130 RepID=A0A7N8XVW0_9TELE
MLPLLLLLLVMVMIMMMTTPHLTHVEDPLLQKHSLIPATVRFRGHICGRHDKLLEIYCRSDQEYLCFLCMAEHKDHDVVSITALKHEKQIQLKRTQQEVTDRMLTSEWKRAKLNDAADSIRDAAWEACDDFERLSAEHVRAYVRSMERKCSDMREKVGEIEKAGLDWTNNHLRQLQCDMLQLRRREDKINQLLLIEDPIQFLKGFQAMGDLPVLTDSHERLDTLTAFVTAQQDKLKNMCKQKKNELFICSEKHVLLKMPMLPEEITSRTKLMTTHGNSRLEIDPNTIAAHLCLSNSNTEISWSDKDQGHPDHAKRFTYFHQALCKQGLKGKHYWEVAWDGGIVELAVSYKSIERKGSGKNCCFGHNHLSWKIICSPSGCTFWHNNLHKGQIPPAHSRRIGVRLDYEAGLLGFYSISDSDRLTLLQQIQTTFSEPLYPGFSVDLGASLAIYATSEPVHINNH